MPENIQPPSEDKYAERMERAKGRRNFLIAAVAGFLLSLIVLFFHRGQFNGLTLSTPEMTHPALKGLFLLAGLLQSLPVHVAGLVLFGWLGFFRGKDLGTWIFGFIFGFALSGLIFPLLKLLI